MKIYLTILLSLLIMPLLVFASTKDDVNMKGSSIISVGGYSLVVSGTANFDSITVNASNFTIDMSKGSQLVVTSTDKRNFTVSPEQYKTGFSCGSSDSTLTVEQDVWDSTITVTITPSSSSCSGGGGGASGGGGGGGSVPTPVAVYIPGTAESTTPTTPTVTTPTAAAVSAMFSSTLSLGMSNSDVKRLQQLLNSDPDTQIAASGVGSPGQETEYYGSLTKEAVKKFQAKYGIVSSGSEETTGYGLVGPGTRAKLQEVFGEAAAGTGAGEGTATPAAPIAAAVSSVFSSGLGKGTSDSDVKRLQQLLNSDPDTQIAASGVGSPGNETEYYGSLTEAAVAKFQVKYGVVSSASDPGYGYVGPKTRAKLQEVFSESVQSSTQTQTQTQTQSQTSGETDLQAQLELQLQQLLEQVQSLQSELEVMQ